MCRVADMWDASACVGLCSTSLAQLQQDVLQPKDFAAVLALLPEAVSGTQQLAAWQASTIAAFVQQYTDVHGLIITPDQRQSFRHLPYPAIKAWMGSDELLVDSEDSMVVALDWWVEGPEGSKCSEEQLKELSDLIHVGHLTAGEECA
jgi:hypothetical protein